MSYKSETLIKAVREAREAAGVSQRALSARAGLTQSHISQIESGKMEPGLSSFIDMARALELEIVVVPKKMVPAVQGLVKAQTAPETRTATQPDKRFDRAERLIKKLKTVYGTSADLDSIDEYLRFLGRVRLRSDEADVVRDLVRQLERHQASPQAEPVIRRIREEFQRLRNTIAHAVPEMPRPAYTLDDEDEDA